MIILAAVDDSGGMMFNKRRQSQDRVLRERILDITRNGRLWMSNYSRGQFANTDREIVADDTFLEKAERGDYCFVENTPLAPREADVESVILFKWNRRYPGDFFFDLDLSAPGWKLTETEEFSGSSHEKITKEVYIRG